MLLGIPAKMRIPAVVLQSRGGFLCVSASALDEATTVQVTLCGDSELNLAYARLVRAVTVEAANRYGFQFIGSAGAKLLE